MEQQKPKRDLVLTPGRMALAEHWRQDWCINAEGGTTPEDITKSGYFAHVAEMLKPYDHIEVRSEDGAWMARLIVINADRNWAHVKMLDFFELAEGGTDVEAAAKKNSVEFKGPHHKWSVIRLVDGEKIKTGCASRDEATTWMNEYEKVAG